LLSVIPGIRDPNYILAGYQIYIPARSSVLPTPSKIKVQKGDTLWKIARTQLGHATYWSCIAHANPGIRNANLIYEGQELLLPASCTP
jgi:nucleoid-associated protein YgaU